MGTGSFGQCCCSAPVRSTVSVEARVLRTGGSSFGAVGEGDEVAGWCRFVPRLACSHVPLSIAADAADDGSSDASSEARVRAMAAAAVARTLGIGTLRGPHRDAAPQVT